MIAAASSRAEASALPRVATVIALAVCVLTAVAHVAYDAGQRRARAGGEARAGQAAADWGAHARAAAEVAGVATPGRPRGVGRALNITESDLMVRAARLTSGQPSLKNRRWVLADRCGPRHID